MSGQQAALLFPAAARPEAVSAPFLAQAPAGAVARTGDAAPVLEAHDLVFRYRERGEAVLRGCSLRGGPGDRLLLEGPSGGGKSTLAALLTGLRQPESGLLLLGGLDRQTLGAEGWPPRPEDVAEAEALCQELGLGELLERMPAGLLQMVGDTGWRLSHGEQSRLYLARALLQGADFVVLDESFAALDPETLQRALRCVLGRAETLLVIAHP
jgi:ATP-binding cassette subfamily B protein